MKKVLSLILALVLTMSVCSFAAFADDPDPEDPGEPGPFYSDFVALQYTNEDGTPAYEVDPQWGAVIIQQQVIYSRWNDKTEAIEGIEYYPGSSTLVMTDLQAGNRILAAHYMEKALNIKVVGSCHLGMIDSFASSIHIYGSGSLTLNENKLYNAGIELDSEDRDILLSFGTGVSVTVYEKDDAHACSAKILKAQGEKPEDRILFDGTHNGKLTQAENERYGTRWIEGYRKGENNTRAYLGNKMTRKSDPDGLYAGDHFIEEDGKEGVTFRKLVYVESVGSYLPDPSFADPDDEDYIYKVIYSDSMYMDEFESPDCDYSFDQNEYGYEISVDNPYHINSYAYETVKTDGKGNYYVALSVYDSSQGDWIDVIASCEEIEELPGFYLFTPVEGVNPEELEDVYDKSENPLQITGYLLQEPDQTTYIAEEVVCDDDPDGIYGYAWRWDEESESSRNFITKYLYDEKHGVYLEDTSVNPIRVDSDDFFDNGPYHIVEDEFGNSVYLKYNGYRIDYCGGLIYEDDKGNRYAVEHYYDEDGRTDRVYTFEPLTIGDDLYMFTPAEGVDADTLTEAEEWFTIEGEVNFIFSAESGKFVYNGKKSDTLSISGTVKSFLPEKGDHAEVKLYKEGEEEPIDSQIMEGCDSPYLFEGLTAGKYVLKADKAHHVAREFEAALTTDTDLEIKICPIGDSNINGSVTSADASAIYKHLSGAKLITDAYAFKCADANQNGSVTSADASAVYKHLSGTKKLY